MNPAPSHLEEAIRSLEAIISAKDTYGAFISLRTSQSLQKLTPKKGPLADLVVAVKDNFCTKDFPTTCASHMLQHYTAPFDATVVRRLKSAGAIIIGKTNMDEFAMGSSTEHSIFGATHNPKDPTRVAGGSSGGSAAAVAAGFVPVALGSDTGGSVRQPASYTGVVGFKPTYGLLSRLGLVAFASSLDTPGILSRTVTDLTAPLEVMSGLDPHDSTSIDFPPFDFVGTLTSNLEGKRIAIATEAMELTRSNDIKNAIKQAAAMLENLGATVALESLPLSYKYSMSTYHIIADAEASANLARFDGVIYGARHKSGDLQRSYHDTRSAGFGSEVTRRILIGTHVLSRGHIDQYYRRATKARGLITDELESLFASGFDFLLTPTTPTTAFKLGHLKNQPLQMYHSDLLTLPASLAGMPALSLPAGADDAGLPMGIQIIGPRFSDHSLISTAYALEQHGGWRAT